MDNILQKEWLLRLLLILAVAAVYGASVSNDFVFFDDDKAILYNQALQNPSLGKFFSGQNLGMYAPFTWIAYWVGQGISGKEAWGFHLLGLLLHALNAVLAFTFLQRLSGRTWAAFFAALLFAVHPMQVEAVSWAAAMSTVLFASFYLLSLVTYLRWADNEKGGTLWFVASLAFFLMSCLSKSAAVTLPLVLVAITCYRGDKKWTHILPYFAAAAFFGFWTIHTREMEGHDIEATSAAFSAADRFFMVCQSLLFYPFKLLFPLGFSISYPFVKIGGSWGWEYYTAPLVLAGLGWVLWKYGRQQRDVLLSAALYFLPIVVMLPYRTVGSLELRSDRYVYFSSLGLFFLGGILLEKSKPALRNGLMPALAGLLAFLAWRQTQVWSNGVVLFENCTDKTPESSLCQCNLAYNQLISNDFQGAAAHYSEALRYDPNTVEAYNGRGQAYFFLRKYNEALADFSKAEAAGIITPKLFLNKGKCLVILNRPAEAVPSLNRSLELEPNAAETYYYRGVAWEKTGELEKAQTDYGQAIRLNPNYVEALVNRGLLRYKAGQFAEAIADYSAALNISTQQVQPMIYNNRALAEMKSGQLNEALRDVNKALELNPSYPFAYNTRAAIYQQTGQADKAAADQQKAQQLSGK